jgi:hypothetical protein
VTIVTCKQEESAALLSQMFAQQLAGNQSYANPMPEEGRAGSKQPSRVIIEGSKVADGQGSEAGGSRSSAPNPFEGLTGLPFQAQHETGELPFCLLTCSNASSLDESADESGCAFIVCVDTRA